MDHGNTNGFSLPDALIAWTTAGALLAFGVIFLDDAVIMGQTILALGLLVCANEGLKLHAWRAGSAGGHRRIRTALAVAYVLLVCVGFLFPPSGR
jgi:hypothetical protein